MKRLQQVEVLGGAGGTISGVLFKALVQATYSEALAGSIEIVFSEDTTKHLLRPTSLANFDDTVMNTVRPGVLYQLYKNFPTLDFFFVDQTSSTIVFIQATIARQHTTADSDLRTIIDYLDKNPPKSHIP